MGPVFLDRQDTGHVGGGYRPGSKVCVFEPSPEQIQVSLLRGFIFLRFTDHGIPLIDDEDELPSAMSFYVSDDAVIQVLFPGKFRIHGLQLSLNGFYDHVRDNIKRLLLSFYIRDKSCYIQAEYIVLIQVPAVVRHPGNFLVIEQFVGIAGTVVICAQHFSGKRLTETARPADTGQAPGRVDGLVDQSNQT